MNEYRFRVVLQADVWLSAKDEFKARQAVILRNFVLDHMDCTETTLPEHSLSDRQATTLPDPAGSFKVGDHVIHKSAVLRASEVLVVESVWTVGGEQWVRARTQSGKSTIDCNADRLQLSGSTETTAEQALYNALKEITEAHSALLHVTDRRALEQAREALARFSAQELPQPVRDDDWYRDQAIGLDWSSVKADVYITHEAKVSRVVNGAWVSADVFIADSGASS